MYIEWEQDCIAYGTSVTTCAHTEPCFFPVQTLKYPFGWTFKKLYSDTFWVFFFFSFSWKKSLLNEKSDFHVCPGKEATLISNIRGASYFLLQNAYWKTFFFVTLHSVLKYSLCKIYSVFWVAFFEMVFILINYFQIQLQSRYFGLCLIGFLFPRERGSSFWSDFEFSYSLIAATITKKKKGFKAQLQHYLSLTWAQAFPLSSLGTVPSPWLWLAAPQASGRCKEVSPASGGNFVKAIS